MGMRYRYPAREAAAHDYVVDGCPVLFVDNSEKIQRVQRMLSDATRVGLDTEFYGYKMKSEHPYGKTTIASTQFSCVGRKLNGVHEARYIFVPNWGEYEGTIRAFKKFLEDDERKKVLHNFKADAHPLANRGIYLRGLKSDTMAKCYLENSGKSHGLKEQVGSELGIDSPGYDEVFKIPVLKKNGEPGKKPVTANPGQIISGEVDWFFGGRKGAAIRQLVKYAVKDPYFTLLLDDKKNEQLSKIEWSRDRSMLEYYDTLDNDFLECLFEMERLGCVLNEEFLIEIRDKMRARVIELEQEFFRQAVKLGASPRALEKLETTSNPQLAAFFTEVLGMELERTKPSNKFPRGQPSVADESLQSVRRPKFRPIINALVELRGLRDKLLGTYIEPWLLNVGDKSSGGRLRTQFKYPGPVTGRLSSSTPNLQNIPRFDEKGTQADRFGIRKAFVAPDDDTAVGDADLSQIEMRVMAHVSQDKALLAAIRNNWDLHAQTALMCYDEVKRFANGAAPSASLFNRIKEEFEAQRQSSKTVNFMIGYGGGPGRYADLNNCSIHEGKRVINEFWKGYPGLKRGIDRERIKCAERGYVKTILGRRIYVPDINSMDQGIRAGAQRASFNYIIQGSAAELIKMTMVLIYKDEDLRRWGVQMVLQVHDELVFYVPKKHLKKAKKKIDAYMSYPYRFFGMKDLSVPTPGEVGYGSNWLEAKAA